MITNWQLSLPYIFGSQETWFTKFIEIISVSVFATTQLIFLMESPDYKVTK